MNWRTTQAGYHGVAWLVWGCLMAVMVAGPAAAPYVRGPITIDGKLDDWHTGSQIDGRGDVLGGSDPSVDVGTFEHTSGYFYRDGEAEKNAIRDALFALNEASGYYVRINQCWEVRLYLRFYEQAFTGQGVTKVEWLFHNSAYGEQAEDPVVFKWAVAPNAKVELTGSQGAVDRVRVLLLRNGEWVALAEGPQVDGIEAAVEGRVLEMACKFTALGYPFPPQGRYDASRLYYGLIVSLGDSYDLVGPSHVPLVTVVERGTWGTIKSESTAPGEEKQP